MVHNWDAERFIQVMTEFAYAYFILTYLMVPFLIWMIWKLSVHQSNQQSVAKMPKPLFIVGILFYISSILAFVGTSLIPASICNMIEWQTWQKFGDGYWFSLIVSYCTIIHWNFFIIILFMRLYYVFKATPFELSKLTIAIFGSIYAVYLGAVCVNYAFDADTVERNRNRGIIFGGQFLLSTYTSFMFIHKVYKVYKEQTKIQTDAKGSTNSENNDSLQWISVITKSTILAVISCTSTMLWVTIYMMYRILEEKGFEAILKVGKYENIMVWFYMLLFLDLSTNCICISLSYSFTTKYYLLICGLCDNWCRKCFSNRFKSNNEKQLSKYVSELHTKSSISDSKTTTVSTNDKSKTEQCSANETHVST